MILYCNNFNATVLHPRCFCNGRLLTVFSIDGRWYEDNISYNEQQEAVESTTNMPLSPADATLYLRTLPPGIPGGGDVTAPPAASLRPPRAEMQLRHCSFVHWREQRASQNGKKTAGRPAKLRRVSRRSCCLFLLRETQRVLRFF